MKDLKDDKYVEVGFKIFFTGFQKKEEKLLKKKFICMKHWTEIITHNIFYFKKIHFVKICLVFFVLLGSTKENQFTSFLIN